ncbi:MAG: LytTR family DNA-binding domain-containing protein [Lachnospiraceae bacterium]|nr:LytTR family DNA-binding domain-containing protein [Lachnospiraceae bacterium]
MNIVICDDDKKICGFLEDKIKTIYQNALIKSFYDADTLWRAAKEEPKQPPDILLLDIQMNRMDGMELARKLRRIGWKTILIFITAYADYVFDAFDVGAFHYLVKPVSDKKLVEVLHKAVCQLAQEKPGMEHMGGDTDTNNARRIAVKSGGVHTSVKVSDIVYAEVFNRKVVIHTTTEHIEYYGKLKSLEHELGGDFYRPHRSYLVNLKYVTKYDSSVIFLQTGQVMMAKQNYAGFVKAYMAYMKRACDERFR